MSLKQPDGSFLVSKNAEVDIRGIYALLVVSILLDILTPELIEGIPSFIASTQTYEGGFASASAPYYISEDTFLDHPRPTLGEAHGGYAGCSIGAWVMLQPLMTEEEIKMLDVPKFLRWLVWMQGEEADKGGFRGRSNKLVDNCYSWWCGGSLAIVEALLNDKEEEGVQPEEETTDTDEDWIDSDWWLYDNSKPSIIVDRHYINNSTEALQEYILGVGQDTPGGLRDKPGKKADVYHTFYALAGLSSAQHRVYHSTELKSQLFAQWKDSKAFIPDNARAESDEDRQKRRRIIWSNSRSWKEDEASHRYVGGSKNRIVSGNSSVY